MKVLSRHCKLVALLVLAPILFALIVPPFEVPDEDGHFAKSVQLAYWTFPTIQDEAGQNAAFGPQGLGKVVMDWPPNYPEVSRRPIANLFQYRVKPATESGEMVTLSLRNLASYPPIFYLPQAAGLRLGRAFDLPALGQFYAGRFAAAVVSVALILCAISVTPFGHRTFLVLATLPGVSQQLGSYSADGVIFGTTFLAAAVSIRGARQASPAGRWVLSVLLPFIALAKGVYLPIGLAGLSSQQAWRAPRLFWTTLWFSAGAVLFAVWFGVIASRDINIQHYVSRRTLEHVSAAVPREQAWFLLQHPGSAVWIIVGSVIERGPIIVAGCIGRFGWLTVAMPLPAYGLGLLVLAASIFASRTDPLLPTRIERLLWLSIGCLVIILIYVALYLTATAQGENYVEGVQGRYFIPALPLLALSLRTRLPVGIERWMDVGLPWAAIALAACGLVTVFTAFWQV